MDKFKLNKYGIILFSTGFAALVYEIVFIKTLSLFMGQSIYAFSVMLAAFMFGIGIGSIYSLKIKQNPLWIFSLTQLGIAAYSILFIPLLNKMSVPSFLISKFPFYLQNSFLIILSLAMLIIPTSLMGLSFPLIVKHVVDKKGERKKIGQLFAYNTLGGLLGSLAAGFIFLPEVGVTWTIIIAAIINLIVAIGIKTRDFSRRTIAAAILVILMLTLKPDINPHAAGSFYNTSLHENLESFILNIEEKEKIGEILYSDFDVYGHVFVLKTGPFKYLYINGKPDGGTSDDATTELLIGYIPMLLHDNPQNVAVIGLGSGLTVGATLQFDAERVDVYEINPGVVKANKYFMEENHHALSDPRTKIIMGDARRNLYLSDKIYDVIISEPSNPWIEGEGFLFTKEYYKIVDERLGEKGVFVQWIGTYDYTEEDLNILMNTIHSIFPHIQIWSDGLDFYIISSREPRIFNFSKTLNQMEKPNIKSDFELIGIHSKKALSPIDTFFSFFLTDYKETGETEINTDDNSTIEFNTARHSGQKRDHVKRLVSGKTKDLPVFLNKDDLGVEIETSLPYYGSKYFIREAGEHILISKEIAFKDDVNTLFVKTRIQPDPPTLDQAKIMAADFNGIIIESKEQMYSFKGENSQGTIGYCQENRQIYLVYSTSSESVNVSCKNTNDK